MGAEEENGNAVRPVLGFNPQDFESVQQEMLRYAKLIQPNYFPKLSLEEVDGKHVLVIWCNAGSNRPYKVPDDVTAKNKVYNYRIRYQSSSIIPEREQEIELLQLNAKIPFDDQVNHHAKVSDISFALMREHLSNTGSKLYGESKGMSVEELADKMNLSEGANEHLFPKNVGLLMFTSQPEQYFKGIQIDVVEYPNGLAGKDFTEKTFTGAIQTQLVSVLQYLKGKVIASKVVKHPNTEKADRFYNYPFAAIEEALSNAVYHRNYELQDPIEVRVLPEAIEIISFNGVDPALKQTDFDKGRVRARRYRNRRIGEFLKELKLTEGRGTGIPTIIKAMKDNGSPAPIFDTNEPDRLSFITELPIHSAFHDQVNDQVNDQVSDEVSDQVSDQVSDEENTSVKILKYCVQAKSNTQIQENLLGLKKHNDNFKRYIEPLLEEGLLERTIPETPRSRNQKYKTTALGLTLFQK